MKNRNKITGSLGEGLAIQYLEKKQYEILETNFVTKVGEIDIIAQHREIIVFIEVKARKDLSYGNPYEAVSQMKQKKIIKTALLYTKMKKIKDIQFRFDIIEVYLNKRDRINHIENAFWT